MKQKFISRLSILAVFTLFLHSCRNDYLPDQQETYNNSSKFQLTSKKISLSESKHKAKLLPFLENAEVEIESKLKGKRNVNGKIVNYGNGISINTDNVIYIENGSVYHTYTFSITREGASENAPVENLVLSPLSDGTYKEILVSYNLSSAEKQTLANGGFVDTGGKATFTDVEKGTFNGNGELAKNITGSSCGYEEQQVWIACSEHVHNQTNVADWADCEAMEGPRMYTVIMWICHLTTDAGTADQPGGGGGSGIPVTGVGGGCTDPGVYTSLPDPNQASGCDGISTQLNDGLSPRTTDPCNKTKDMLARPNVQLAISEIKKQAEKAALDINEGEIGRIEKNDGTINPADVSADHHVIFNNITGSKGIYHNHTFRGAKVHSPPDIYSILGFAGVQPTVANYGDAYVGMVGATKCSPDVAGCYRIFHYIIHFSGTASDLTKTYTDDEMDELIKYYRNRESKLSETLPYVDFLGDTTLNKKGLEKLFFDTVSKMKLSGKVTLQRVDDDGLVKIITLDEEGVPKATPCP